MYIVCVLRCLSKRKDTNFKANHNSLIVLTSPLLDVCLSAKIRILKQITTSCFSIVGTQVMFV